MPLYCFRVQSTVDEKFISERCGEYAVALHERLGLPIYAVTVRRSSAEPAISYAFVSADGGETGIDARGVVRVDELRAACAPGVRPGSVAVTRVSRERLVWELGIVEDEHLAEARQIVAEKYAPASEQSRVEG